MTILISRAQKMLHLALIRAPAVTIIGDSAAASATLSSVADTTLISVGDKVFGPGWIVGATVLSKTSNTIVMTIVADATQVAGHYRIVRAPVEANLLSNVTFHLLKTDLAPLDEVSLATLAAEEADYGGYAALAGVSFLGPIVNDDDIVELMTTNLVWIKDGTAVANTIYGYYVTDNADAQLLYWEKLPTPQPMSTAGEAVAFVSRFDMPHPTAALAPTE